MTDYSQTLKCSQKNTGKPKEGKGKTATHNPKEQSRAEYSKKKCRLNKAQMNKEPNYS